jgi:hypothetical protein
LKREVEYKSEIKSSWRENERRKNLRDPGRRKGRSGLVLCLRTKLSIRGRKKHINMNNYIEKTEFNAAIDAY